MYPPCDAAGDEEDQGGGDDGAENLGDDVHDRVLRADSFGEQYAECDCRIDVTTGNRADGVDHRQQRQTKGEGNSHIADVTAGEHGAAHSAEHQHKSPQEFRKIFSHGKASFL